MSRDDDPAALNWTKSQATKGAMIIGVCAGAKVVAAAGLLTDKRATTHWYFLAELRKKHPAIHYVADRRLVVDEGVVTTTDVTASMPMALTLIEAIAGRDKAQAVGRDLGLMSWDARHGSAAFSFTRPFALAAIGNTLAFWSHDLLGIEVTPGLDEVSLALVADAWSRTYRSRAVTFAGTEHAQLSRNGILLSRTVSPRAGLQNSFCRRLNVRIRPRYWTKLFVLLPPAMAHTRPTLLPCSSNTQRERHASPHREGQVRSS
jgi:putative intracellular protease/amidase